MMRCQPLTVSLPLVVGRGELGRACASQMLRPNFSANTIRTNQTHWMTARTI
jgi:hypothetical protein